METIKKPKKKSQFLEFCRRFSKNKAALIGFTLFIIILFFALFADFFVDYELDAITHGADRLASPSAEHIFGTDNYGRDIFARVLYGTRNSLQMALTATLSALGISIVIGAVAAFYGGIIDNIIMRILDISMAFPFMVLAIIVAAIVGPGVKILLISSWLVAWREYARLIRAEVLVQKNSEYVQSAISMGYTNARIMFRHILPNVISSAVVYGASDIVICMMSAASLSFLGLGVQAPTPEWGAIISSGKAFLGTAWWITVIPGLVLAFTGWGFSMIGDGLSDMLRARGK